VGQPRVVGHAGQPEVDQDRGAPLHQDVGRLDVAVQDPRVVDRCQGLGQAAGEPDEIRFPDASLLLDVVVERETRDV
ncbi:MAG: hypothetical protein AVDCRST_MAG60-860, partial [uncultured Nocardioides sp.]